MTMKTAKSKEMHLHALYMRFCILLHFSSVEHRHKMTEMNSFDDNHFRLPSTYVVFFFPIYLWFGITYLEQSAHLQHLRECMFPFSFPHSKRTTVVIHNKNAKEKVICNGFNHFNSFKTNSFKLPSQTFHFNQ